MNKSLSIAIIAILLVLGVYSFCRSAEELKVTTYYPSPYGSYVNLTAKALNVTAGNVTVAGELQSTMGTGYGQLRAVNGNYGFMIRNDGSATYLLLTNSGDQYGLWNALRPFTIANANGYVYLPQNAALTTTNAANVWINSADGLLYRFSSSIRYKKDVNYGGIDGSKTFLLKPASFKEKRTGAEHVGFIAEDVAKIEPRLVEFNDQGQPESVEYAQITALLAKTIQDRQARLEKLQKRIDALEKKKR